MCPLSDQCGRVARNEAKQKDAFCRRQLAGGSCVQERVPTHSREILLLFKNTEKLQGVVFCILLKSTKRVSSARSASNAANPPKKHFLKHTLKETPLMVADRQSGSLLSHPVTNTRHQRRVKHFSKW